MTTALPAPLSREPDRIALAALSRRIGAELTVLADLSARVQAALPMRIPGLHIEPGASRDLQGIDRVTQTLEDLGRLMAALSAEIDAGLVIRAGPLLACLRLHELGASLTTDHDGLRTGPAGDVTWL